MTCRPPKMNPHLGLSPKRNPYLGLRFPPCLLPDRPLTRFPLDNRKAGSCTVWSDPFGHRLWQWKCAPHCVRFLSGGVYSWRRGRGGFWGTSWRSRQAPTAPTTSLQPCRYSPRYPKTRFRISASSFLDCLLLPAHTKKLKGVQSFFFGVESWVGNPKISNTVLERLDCVLSSRVFSQRPSNLKQAPSNVFQTVVNEHIQNKLHQMW